MFDTHCHLDFEAFTADRAEVLGRARAAVAYDQGQGARCSQRAGIDGSAGFVTGAFGLACAIVVVRALLAPANAAGSARQP